MADDRAEESDEDHNLEPLLVEDVLHVVDPEDGVNDDDLSDDQADEGIPDESMESMDVREASKVDDSVCTFDAHTGSVFSASLHPNKALAVTGGEDDKAFVWNTETGDIVFECSGHKDSVACTAFSSDGNLVASADMSGCIKVWGVDGGQCVWSFQSEDIEWQLWHSSAPILLVGTSVGDVWMWKIPSGDCKVMHSRNVSATTAALCPNGKNLLCGYGDGGVRLWDLKESKPIHHWDGGSLHAEQVTCISVHSENVLGLSGSSDGSVKLLSLTSGKILSTWCCEDDFSSSVETLEFCTSSPLAAAGSLKGTITVWDISTQKERCRCNAEVNAYIQYSMLIFTTVTVCD
jgi:ribosome assembly protein SQT1